MNTQIAEKPSLEKAVRHVVARTMVISAAISLVVLIFASLIFTRTTLVANVFSFLLDAKYSLESFARELSYEDPSGYNQVSNFLKKHYSFSDISWAEKVEINSYSCIYKETISSSPKPAQICVINPFNYQIILPLDTLSGEKTLIFNKKFSPFSKNLLLVTICFLVIFGLMTLLFYFFYRRLIHLAIIPLKNLYNWITNQSELIDSPFIEVHQIGKVVQKSLESQRQIDKLNATVETIQMVAHDVRKPLNMARLFTKRARLLPLSMLKQYSETSLPLIDKATNDAANIIQDLLNINSNRPEQKIPLNLNDLIVEVTSTYFPKVELNFNQKPLWIFANQQKVSRSLCNILSNATEASHGVGKIWINTLQDGDFITLEIGNTGSSILQENLNRIFDSFWTQNKKEGHGLGLAITKKFIEEQGGTIICESNGHRPDGKPSHGIADFSYVLFIINLPIYLDRASR